MKKLFKGFTFLMAIAIAITVFTSTSVAYAATPDEFGSALAVNGDAKLNADGSYTYTAKHTSALTAGKKEAGADAASLLTDASDGSDDLRDTFLKAYKKRLATDKIDAISSELGIEADTKKGAELISLELRELISQIIGGITIAILTAVGLFTAIDVLFLEVPPLHTALEENAAAKGQTDKNGNPKPRFVSKDAVNAYNEGNDNGKNVIITYLKKRVVAYIAVAVVVFLLLTGQLSAIINVVLKLISGVVNAVTNI